MLNRPQDQRESQKLDEAFCTLHGQAAWNTVLAWLRSEEIRITRESRNSEGVPLHRQQGGSLAIESLDHHYQDAVKARGVR